MKKLRLLFTEECNRSCPGCCNKQFDLSKLPKATSFDYDEIYITGGEPLLQAEELMKLISHIRSISTAKIIIYTAFPDPLVFFTILSLVDGITLTLHDEGDITGFYMIETIMSTSFVSFKLYQKSLRLNVFKEVNVTVSEYWTVKKDIVWFEDCPLPEDEEFKRI